MLIRHVAGDVGWPQILVAAGLIWLSTAGVSWAAGRIFRVGLLMSGKRPTARELWRWVREG